ncbi:hypothetical protein AYO21_02577 [Fonsecaea monophora]|uniref:Uncharacterized protein n=1 Tax=Fonsecaea monophora TaxID=254056 RepID=A0A177FHS6_9EURO|nr:hypothetical protein AYO21_02577 [Fonsecaea monophora]OAG43291.1 hypothetical protein AYO21_02577 [Fonsecaea monophora]
MFYFGVRGSNHQQDVSIDLSIVSEGRPPERKHLVEVQAIDQKPRGSEVKVFSRIWPRSISIQEKPLADLWALRMRYSRPSDPVKPYNEGHPDFAVLGDSGFKYVLESAIGVHFLDINNFDRADKGQTCCREINWIPGDLHESLE